jgi:hypothetical protein
MIQEINCGIFRHGILKENNQQIDQHAPKRECDRLVKNNLIIGCGKPFKLVMQSAVYIAEKCDYL